MSSSSPTPTDDQEPRLLDHEYDGIHEYDNPLPRWWLWIFYASIVYSILYWFNVPGIGVGAGRLASYEADVAGAQARATALAAEAPGMTEDALLALTREDEARDRGRTTFGQMCVSCHGPDGGGVIGPNLTDDAWIHGGKPMEIHRTVTEGVLEKGMPAWGRMLTPDDLNAVVAYVITLRGTTPASPKAPEGAVLAPGADSAAGPGTG